MFPIQSFQRPLATASAAATALWLVAGIGAAQAEPPSEPAQVSWADVDGDGLDDALYVDAAGRLAFLRNDGDGRFVDETRLRGLDAFAATGLRAAAWSDLDGDGRVDLYLSAFGAPSRLLRQNEAGAFDDVTAESGLPLLDDVLDARWLDFDQDDREDLLVATRERRIVFHNTQAGFGAVELFGEPDRRATGAPLANEVRALAGTDTEPEGEELEAVPESPSLGRRQLVESGASSKNGTGGGPSDDLMSQATRCAETIEDMMGGCLAASSTPTLGMLYPLSADWYVEAGSGRVGLGTTSPAQRLDVDGAIRSRSVGFVYPDGTIQATAQLQGPQGAQGPPGPPGISGGSFGQTVRHNGTAWIPDSNITNNGSRVGIGTTGALLRLDVRAGVTADVATVRGEGAIAQTDGYLGVQGKVDFDGNASADWSGLDIGGAGISNGTSTGDNYGVVGHSNGVGVRGEHADDPTSDYGELGRQNVGVYGHGSSTGVEGVGDFGFGVGVKGYGNLYSFLGDHDQGVGGAFYGHSTSTIGATWGAYGVCDSEDGTGLRGEATSAVGDTIGVRGSADSPDGLGMLAENTAAVGIALKAEGASYGVLGTASNTGGIGVRGENATSNTGTGVHGQVVNGFGVLGQATGTANTQYGVYGISASFTGRAVYGSATHATGINTGVRGATSSPNGYGLYSVGDFAATGTKSFLQPDPSDPGRQIRFYCLEGGEAGTYFRGSAQLEGGSFTIEVPESFRLSSDDEGLTVQLTAMGPGAGLWVESKGLDRIVVRGDWDAEFDYQVNGVRRGFEERPVFEANHAFVPEERGVPFGTQYPDAVRRMLVENGTLNPDFTPNEATAAAMGWTLQEPQVRDERTLGSDGEARGE